MVLNWKILVQAPEAESRVVAATTIPRFYWRVAPAREEWVLHFAVNQTEITPKFLESDGFVFIGVEQGVVAVNATTGAIVAEVTDTSYVQAIELTASGQVLVSGETEMIGFDASSGSLLWRTPLPDAIETFEEMAGQVTVHSVDGATFVLNLITGKPARR